MANQQTVTVTMTREQAEALNEFAVRGCDDWQNYRPFAEGDYTKNEIENIDKQMDPCDQALYILIEALQE